VPDGLESLTSIAAARRLAKDALRPYVVTGRRLLRRDLRLTDIGYARRVSYSQFGEDLWLDDYFRGQATGFYVDVGAFDPFDGSNTLLLYRRGWSGLNIEPNPDASHRFRRFRRRDHNLSLAISDDVGNVQFISRGSFAGLDAVDYLWSRDATPRITVRTRRLSEVLDEYRPTGEIDLLDVDCEGHELAVLRSNDWERYRPRIVLAERHDSAPDDVAEFLENVGYRRVSRFTLTDAFERSS
jgi:FkbM family methyltransferase